MMANASMRVDSTGHAMIEVQLEKAGGISVVGEVTTLEAERLIKDLRRAIDSASSHNRSRNARRFP